MVTPTLILEVSEAVEDYRITAKEFNDIMVIVTGIFLGVAMVTLHNILTEPIFKGFAKETGIKMEKKAGVVIPTYG